MKNNTAIDITNSLREKHGAFMKKYGSLSEKKIADKSLQVDQVYAKIVMVAKAFEKAGITTGHDEVAVRSVSEHFPRSIAMLTVAGAPVYILNGGTYVVVTDGIVSEDPLSRAMVMLSESKHSTFMKTYKDVLSEDFDWKALSMEVLDAVHKVAYYSAEVMFKYFENIGGKNA